MATATYERRASLLPLDHGLLKDRHVSSSFKMSRASGLSYSMSTKPTKLPDKAAIIRTAGTVLKTSSVEIERYDGCLYRTYLLRGREDSFCVMRCPPQPTLRLLRIEEDRLAIEAQALHLLSRRRAVTAPSVLDDDTASSNSFLISGPFTGSILGDLDRSLSVQRQEILDRSLGRYIRRVSSLTGPAFGPLDRPCMQSWARCFASMLETVLRDAEDSLASLPYDSIRMQVRRHSRSLERVTEPRLVLVEAADEDNIVFDESTGQVTSLFDYGTAMWADPFFSDCFCQPSEAFLDGYGESLGTDADKRIRQLL